MSREADPLCEMANLYPRDTGLPMTIWVSPRGGAKRDVRVKVNVTHGDAMDIHNTVVVGVRPQPSMIQGRLSKRDQSAVFAWVSKNTDILVGYWEGTLSTVEMASRLQKL